MDFLVEPKTFIDPAYVTYNITAIRCRMVRLDFSLTKLEPHYYFEFIDSTGRIRADRNANRFDFMQTIRIGIQQQYPELTDAEIDQLANSETDTLIYGLMSSDPLVRYASASSLAQAYGYTALPFSEQPENGQQEL